MTQREQSRRGIGSYVKAQMDAHEPVLTQKDLALALQISQPAASRKLSGERGFDLHELLPLAELLGVPVHQILTLGLDPTAAETKLPQPRRRSTDIGNDRLGDTRRASALIAA